jgi:predicted Rossmann fold nucleotide-binding protein DprA/Smf involved in DNA uptake
VITGSEISEIKPPASLESFFDGKAPKIWGLGEPSILDGPLLGILSARQIDSDLALKSSQLIKQLASSGGVAFVGGWHSPLEEETLRILLADSSLLVFCIPKALNRFVPSLQIASRINEGRLLLLTHCSPKAKRISRDASIRRNRLVLGLANALLVLSAPAGSATLTLAKSALRRGKPVFSPAHSMNTSLLSCGALPATLENLQTTLG